VQKWQRLEIARTSVFERLDQSTFGNQSFSPFVNDVLGNWAKLSLELARKWFLTNYHTQNSGDDNYGNIRHKFYF